MAIVALFLFFLSVALISFRDDNRVMFGVIAVYAALTLSSIDMMHNAYDDSFACECMQTERDNQYLD